MIFHHSSQKTPKNQLLIILINKLMNNEANPKSVDSQPIWLKSVRSEVDWLDLTNPWLKELIKSDPELILSILYGEFHPPSLLHMFGLLWIGFGWCVRLWVDVSVQSAPWLTRRLSGISIQLQIGINGLSFSCNGLSPWDLRPTGLDLLFFV